MIIDYIEQHPGCLHKDLLVLCKGCKKRFYAEVKRLADEGKIIRVYKSIGGPGRTYLYYPLTAQEKKAVEENIVYRPQQTLYNPAYRREVKSVFEYR